jgi:hypothetical protein
MGDDPKEIPSPCCTAVIFSEHLNFLHRHFYCKWQGVRFFGRNDVSKTIVQSHVNLRIVQSIWGVPVIRGSLVGI